MRGELVCCFDGDVELLLAVHSTERDFDERFDDFFFYPFLAPDADDLGMANRIRSDAYWSILRYCAHRGMISGRGVQPAVSLASASPY